MKTRHPQSIKLKKYAYWLDVYDVDEGMWCPQRLFLLYHEVIPHVIKVCYMDCQKAAQWFTETFEEDIKDYHYTQRKNHKCKEIEYDELYYWMYEDLLVYFNTADRKVSFLFRQTEEEKVQALIDGMMKFKMSKTPRRQPEMNVLIHAQGGIDTQEVKVLKPSLSLEENYNDDLLLLHQVILKRLRTKNDKGLLLLHGKPGTGKTSYIRYLISQTRKDVIFLPPNMASAITDPGLMSVLLDNPNSIFVIEDAENIIIDRNKNGYSAVSTLLNLADGLLSDCLNIQIICTFNTDLTNVNTALMRKGRLIAKYEFKELETVKAQALLHKLGHKDATATQPMTLSAIYNHNDHSFEINKENNTIGFKTKNK